MGRRAGSKYAHQTEWVRRVLGMGLTGLCLLTLLLGARMTHAQSDDEPVFIEANAQGVANPPEAGSIQCTNSVTYARCVAYANPGYRFSHYDRNSAGCHNRDAWQLAWCSEYGNVIDIPVAIVNGQQNGMPGDVLYVQGYFTLDVSPSASPPEGGTVTCSPASVTKGGSSVCTAQASLGWRFDGFSGDCTGSSCELSNIAAPPSVVGNFSYVGTRTITTSAVPPEAGGSVSCSPNPVTVGESSRCIGTGALGWVLSSFSGACSGPTCVLDNITTDLSVTGHFSVASTVNIATQADPVAGGSVSCDPNPATVGGRSTCTATTNPGYVFSGFSGDCSGSSCQLDPVGANASVTANYTALPTYPVNMTIDPPEGGVISCTLNPVYQGGTTACEARANAGYELATFLCLNDCGHAPDGRKFFYSVTAPVGLEARFNRVSGFNVSTRVQPPGAGSVSCTPAEVASGGSATCSVSSTAQGYRFVFFSGDCSGPTCSLSNVTADRTVTAHFTRSAPALNDSGEARCDDGTAPVTCTAASTGDSAYYPRQDARYGRDAAAAAGQLSKTGTGPAGFDYTRLAVDGSVLSGTATPGVTPGDWGCTRDNVTGLTWEIKTTDTGARDMSRMFLMSEAQSHVDAINALRLCGFDDWRVPSRLELSSLLDYSRAWGLINPDYFPNSVSQGNTMGIYWSSDLHARDSRYGLYYWYVMFNSGGMYSGGSNVSLSLRLVRGGR